ncbi:unnamed protein product [Spirodela intermedia]|uniref:Uncharacterized protein n=1 Tax=Spirodela intermedia TaxID=51605 RepID=A0A7I8KY21_SPIIN|nr:unnamed protein product [Spirodela intermedia]
MPPPLVVSMASKIATTSSISGRRSGFASQHLFITFPSELGQHRGISGRRSAHLPDDGRGDLGEGEVRVGHVAAVDLPQADPKAVDVALPVVGVAVEHLKATQKSQPASETR